MPPEEKANTVREAVGVFSTPETLQEAIDELMSSGFDRADLSMLAAEGTVDEKLGHKYQKIAELEDDPIVPRCCYVSTEAIGDAQAWLVGGLMYVGAMAATGAVMASGGTLALVIAAAALAGALAVYLALFWPNGSVIIMRITSRSSWTMAACSYGYEPGMPRTKSVLSAYSPSTPVETCTFTHCQSPVEH
jgi:hypothetical protein